jgi:hypothetical protein
MKMTTSSVTAKPLKIVLYGHFLNQRMLCNIRSLHGNALFSFIVYIVLRGGGGKSLIRNNSLDMPGFEGNRVLAPPSRQIRLVPEIPPATVPAPPAPIAPPTPPPPAAAIAEKLDGEEPDGEEATEELNDTDAETKSTLSYHDETEDDGLVDLEEAGAQEFKLYQL